MVSPHEVQVANLGSFFGVDGLVILVVGLLIFGRRLPEVGKNVGKTIVEFKKGLSGAYSDDKNAAPEETPEEPAPAPRRLASSGSGRVAVSTPARAASKSLPQTEEV
jgi:sec-independent protein translocase protein TatA